MNYSELKKYQRAHRENFHANLVLRTHRALSWLDRSERSEDDLDAKFIFLWIAFNASYAVDIDQQYREAEKAQFFAFFEKINGLDSEQLIYQQLWKNFSSTIRVLLDNRFVFQPFWDYHNGKITEAEWTERFRLAKAKAGFALANQETADVLSIVFNRLYTLRNQIIHGGATWNSGANRDQVRECTKFLETLVPIIIKIMMENPDTLWGDAHYPVVSA